MSLKHFSLGFLTGAIAGAVFAFLPDENGKSTREYLKEDADGFKEAQQDLEDSLSRAHEAGERLASSVPEASQLLADLNTNVDHFKEEADREINALQAKIDQLTEDLNGDLNQTEN